MRTPNPIVLALMIAAALAQPAAALTIDNFEQGGFNFADDSTAPGFTQAEQSGLLTTNVVGGVRLVRNFATGTLALATAALVETPADDSASFTYTGAGGTGGEFHLIYDGLANLNSDTFSGLLGLDLSALTGIQIDATAAAATVNVEVQLYSSSTTQTSTTALVNGATLIPLSNYPLVDLADIRAIRVILSGIDPGELPLVTNIAVVVPEPASGLLVAAGLVAMAVARKRA